MKRGLRRTPLPFGGSPYALLAIAIGIVTVPQFTRTVRSPLIETKTSTYVQAARAGGGGGVRIMLRHILTDSLSPIIMQSALTVASAILNTVALGFLGLGAQPPRPEWSVMLSGGRLPLLAPGGLRVVRAI